MDHRIGRSEEIVDISGTWAFGWVWGLLWCFALFGGIYVLGQIAGTIGGTPADWTLAPYVGFAWIALIIRSKWGLADERRLRSRGLRTSATITEVTYKEHGDGNPGWLVHYEYRVPGGEDQVGSRYFADRATSVQLGDEIPIIYDPTRPRLNGWVEARAPSHPFTQLVVEEVRVVVVLAIVGIVLLLVVIRVFDDPAWWSTTAGALFVLLGIVAFPAVTVLNGDPGPSESSIITQGRSLLILGLGAEALIAFGMLCASPLNHP